MHGDYLAEEPFCGYQPVKLKKREIAKIKKEA
jgi:hypothetical protein